MDSVNSPGTGRQDGVWLEIGLAHPFSHSAFHTLIIEIMHYDLCLPWYWEYDIDFVQMIERACHEQRE